MAISTYGIQLMHKVSDKYEQLVPIKDFPDLGGSPEMLETTTLSDKMQTYIPGIQTLDGLEFSANYTKEDFSKLKALEGKDESYAVFFGADGADGKFEFKGSLSVFPVGGGVNEVVGMTISIAPSTPITIGE